MNKHFESIAQETTRRALSAWIAAVSLVFVLAGALCADAAQSVALQWDANTEPDLAGYRVHYGVTSGSYTEHLDVGNVTSATVPGLTEGITYYFAVTAYNTSGVESEFSDEVAYTIPLPNLPPVANAASVSGAEDSAVSVTLTGSDPEGSPLTFLVLSSPANGTLSGTVPSLIYTPRANFNGSDSFTFKVNDGSLDSAPATVSISVTAVNDAPVADPLALTTAEDTAASLVLSGSDVEGSPLTYAIVSGPTRGTLSGAAPSLVYTPSANFNGSDSFTFRVNDGSLDSAPATVSISVTAVNDAPVANSQTVRTMMNVPVNITLSASDVDGDWLRFVIVAQPLYGGLNGEAPNLVYTPNGTYAGPDTFAFVAHDGAADSAPATVTINIAKRRIRLAGESDDVDEAPAAAEVALRVERVAAGELQISWLAAAEGYILESTPALDGEWTILTAPVAVEGDSHVVRLSAHEAYRFFRLQRAAGELLTTQAENRDAQPGI